MFSDFTAIVRWSLPGWVFWLTLALPHVLSVNPLVDHHSGWLQLFSQTGAGSFLASVSAMLLAVSIPIGFIIYQFYFLYYWIVGDRSDWGSWTEIPIATARETSVADEVRRLAKTSTHEAWFAVEQRWYTLLATESRDAINLLAARTSRLFDLYHALGAIEAALSLGTLANAFSVGSWPVFWQWGVLVPYAVIVASVSFAVAKNRSYTRKNLVQFQNNVMRFLEAKEAKAQKQ